ncbi:MAG: hypothetical protein ICV62_07540 [Cyanobacteria bacterium Co-bin13]|nr:hypothetical protein [Cyanobacteria bacterium Co-bin13]
MSRPAYKPGDNLSLFTAAEDPALVSTQFWVQLLRYRPIFLLGSLWLGLICVAAVAYSRLMFAGAPPSTLDANSPVATESRSANRQPRAASSPAAPPTSTRTTGSVAPTVAEETAEMDRPDAAAAEPAEVISEGFPAWSLGSVVGLCALGCFLMQRRLAAPAQPRLRPGEPDPKLPKGLKRAAGKRPGRPSRTRHQAAAKSAEPKRLAPFSPERDQIVVPNRPPLSRSLGPAVNRDAGPKPSAASQSRPLAPAANLVQQSEAPLPEVTVVAPQESMALDWPEGSLAHSLDIRQRRSLSSFM